MPSFGNCTLQLGRVYMYVTSFISVQFKIGGMQKNLQLTWHPSQGWQNVFFPSNYPLHYLFRDLEHA